MSEHRFDERVAIITGAGRGIGAAYAELLAARGASVVVNDLGTSMGGRGADISPAEQVVAGIEARGGTAVADTGDVSDPDDASALVATAIERFGRLDIVVNNAGIMRWSSLPELDLDAVEQHVAVHVAGSFNTARAAWGHFVDRGYGRIVMTTSAGVFGLPNNTAYATAKGGVIGLTRSLHTAGAPHGIAVNAVAPAAMTRMAGRSDDADPTDPAAMAMAPDLVAPLVGYLAHENCPTGGQIYAAGAGRFSRIVLGSTPGYLSTTSTPTIEEVAANWDTVNELDDLMLPEDLMAWSRSFTAHLTPDGSRPIDGDSDA